MQCLLLSAIRFAFQWPKISTLVARGCPVWPPTQGPAPTRLANSLDPWLDDPGPDYDTEPVVVFCVS